MTSKEAAHIVDVAFGVPRAVRRVGEDRTYHEGEIKEAKDMAIKALEQEPCEDAISREYLKQDMIRYGWTHPDSTVTEYVDSLPPVQPEQKTGHWEWVQYDSNPNIGNWHCSECRCVVIECGDKKSKGDIPLYKYCPQCGCRIVEPQESEESK